MSFLFANKKRSRSELEASSDVSSSRNAKLVQATREFINSPELSSEALKTFHATVQRFLQREIGLQDAFMEIRSVLKEGGDDKFRHFVSLFLLNDVDENLLVNNGLSKSELEQGKQEITTSKKPKNSPKQLHKEIRCTPNKFTEEESAKLRKLVRKHGMNWKVVSNLIGSKTSAQCAQHWKRVIDPAIKKGPWLVEEEEALLELAPATNFSWVAVAEKIKGRIDTDCYYRYQKLMKLSQEPWSQQEKNWLKNKVQRKGDINWNEVAQRISNELNVERAPIHCRDAWNQLNIVQGDSS